MDSFLTDLCAVPSLDIPELTDDTLILFDGRMCLFGSLMIQDKKTVEWNPIGECYMGGYPTMKSRVMCGSHRGQSLSGPCGGCGDAHSLALARNQVVMVVDTEVVKESA
jgi:hypothetical protein